jgi:hypothetical protein
MLFDELLEDLHLCEDHNEKYKVFGLCPAGLVRALSHLKDWDDEELSKLIRNNMDLALPVYGM